MMKQSNMQSLDALILFLSRFVRAMSVLLSARQAAARASCRLWRIPESTKTCNRTFVDLSWRRFFPKKQHAGVKLVYENNNMWYIGVCHASLVGCGTILVAWNLLVCHNPELARLKDNYFETEYPIVFLVLSDLFMAGIFLFANLIRTKSLMRITYDQTKKVFEAKKFDFFFRNRYITFKPGEVHHIAQNPKLMPRGNFVIKSKKYYLHTGDFKSPLYYNIMLGRHNPKGQMD